MCVRERKRTSTRYHFHRYTVRYIHTVERVCICVYSGPPIDLGCFWVRPGPRLIMVLVWGGFVAGWVGGGWGCYTCELCYCKPHASSLTWSSRYVSLGENDFQLPPLQAKGEISHIWFIYTLVQKWRNIKKEIQICFKEWENPSFPAGYRRESNFWRNAQPLLQRYIGAFLYWYPNR